MPRYIFQNIKTSVQQPIPGINPGNTVVNGLVGIGIDRCAFQLTDGHTC
jgi:hypothetical protein